MNISMETVDSLDITFSAANMNLLNQKLLSVKFQKLNVEIFLKYQNWGIFSSYWYKSCWTAPVESIQKKIKDNLKTNDEQDS